jgi:hypothetical protein
MTVLWCLGFLGLVVPDWPGLGSWETAGQMLALAAFLALFLLRFHGKPAADAEPEG